MTFYFKDLKNHIEPHSLITTYFCASNIDNISGKNFFSKNFLHENFWPDLTLLYSKYISEEKLIERLGTKEFTLTFLDNGKTKLHWDRENKSIMFKTIEDAFYFGIANSKRDIDNQQFIENHEWAINLLSSLIKKVKYPEHYQYIQNFLKTKENFERHQFPTMILSTATDKTAMKFETFIDPSIDKIILNLNTAFSLLSWYARGYTIGNCFKEIEKALKDADILSA